MSGKLKLVVSDFHIGDGQEEGELNPWESFHHDEKFSELLRHYSTDYYEDEDVELIINGDFFDLLMVRYDGGFPTEITERIGVTKLKSALDGHPQIVQALRQFVNVPGKRITVLPGNHDFELIFPACQRLFRDYVCGRPDDPRMQFVVERSFYEFDGVQVHHGMQFEAMNRFDWKRLFMPNPKGGDPILKLPWGSIFILTVLTEMKEKRPYIDHVTPFSLYLFGALFLDTKVALRLIWLAIMAFVRTRLMPMFRSPGTFRLRDLFGMLFEYEAFPDFDGKVRKLFRKNPRIHTVLMGHTHLASVRRFGHAKTYINTGTWTNLISLDISQLGHNNDLTYAAIEYPVNQPPRARLLAWRGYHDLYRDIYY